MKKATMKKTHNKNLKTVFTLILMILVKMILHRENKYKMTSYEIQSETEINMG